MSRPLPERKPWPLKWIVLAIVLFIGAYTFLTLHYRKTSRPYEPHQDMQTRANTGRLLAAGYQRVELPADRPVTRLPANTSNPAPGGLPAPLRQALVTTPHLPSDIVLAHGDPAARASEPYEIHFRCVTPDEKQQLSRTELFVKGDEIVVAPSFGHLAAGLQARTRDSFYTVTVPPGTLRPGRYRVTVTGENSSRAWSLQVQP
ncbi:hypothetical protein [Opitutus sp. ER46]|uniref:hypothetical protein n=1 Tax=Opitutus sp. ER46 TaxID=2161864 RepID=UPI000D3123DA|nr:hypothetical protein [Opitutus sp. ER46]PTX99020.1 hypothetical protein DB354_03100 [Opitutus sp. ER46]